MNTSQHNHNSKLFLKSLQTVFLLLIANDFNPLRLYHELACLATATAVLATGIDKNAVILYIVDAHILYFSLLPN